MPHRGLIGRRKKYQHSLSILRDCRDYLEVDTYKEIMPTLRAIIKERDVAERKLTGLTTEFNKKKIGVRTIRKRGKVANTTKAGIVYFNKQHIGKRVIIWEKR